MTIDTRPSLLIVSFSDISNDARVKKQISCFAERFRVTTCGRGRAIREDVEHIQLDAPESQLRAVAQAMLLRVGQWRAAFGLETEVKLARRLLRGRDFDVAIANDIESIPVAAERAGYDQTLADLHEYWPGLHDQLPNWVRLRQPYYRWMIRTFAARAGAAMTVSATIADRYRDEFGFTCSVVHNATPKHELTPGPVGDVIRVVHSGGAQPNREPEVMMRAVARSTAPIQLDMYLTGQETAYAQSLRELAKNLGDRVRILPPKPYDELIATLNTYDVGIHFLPPTNTNNSLALPNKMFDYVQARLALVVGPTADMAQRVNNFGLGIVAEGFDEDSIVGALDRLTVETVRTWKDSSHQAADTLNSDTEIPVLAAVVDGLLSTGLPKLGSENANTDVPEIDVISAVHKASRPIERAVNSVLRHTRANVRVTVVVHNTDSGPILQRLGRLLDDPRVRVITHSDGFHTPAGPKNAGLDLATAQFVAMLDSDDTLEPGALDAWLAAARQQAPPADAVIAPTSSPGGRLHPSPPIRWTSALRRRVPVLHPVRDRLAYRASPLGLIGRARFGHLRFAEGIETGEDQPLTAELWFTSGSRVVFPVRAPRYLEHDDQMDRVTGAPRSVADTFRSLDLTLDDKNPWASSARTRRALAVKIVRVHLFDGLRQRLPNEWTTTTARELAGVAGRILAWAPGAEKLLSRADAALLDAILAQESSSTTLAALLHARGQLRTAHALLPRNLRFALHREAPLRYHAAGALLLRATRSS